MGSQSLVRRLEILALGSALWLLPLSAAEAQDGNGTLLEKITLESESGDTLKQNGYVAKQDRDGTKVDTPIVQIPQAITVITQDQIEDQKPRSLNEALNYTASANPNAYGSDSRYDAFFLRGFRPTTTACSAMDCASTTAHRPGSRPSRMASKVSPS